MTILQIAGSIASISAWVVALFFQWQGDPGVALNIAIITAVAFSLGTGFFYLWPRIIGKQIASLSDEIIISLNFNREYEVLYPRPFKRTPNLRIECTEGGIDFEIVDQRADGFRFRTLGPDAYGSPHLRIRWTAKGDPL